MSTSNIDGLNSPNCGKCYMVEGPAGARFITAIDQSVPAAGGGMRFDIHPQAFREIMGEKSKSGVPAIFREVASSKCKGNKG
jgi:expansin (peptidoglycan-binding protein)